LAARPIHDLGQDYDLHLDQWIGKVNATRDELLAFFEKNPRFVEGEDNLAFDLSLQGCLKANQKFKTGNKTYYFSLVTHATHEEGLLGLPFLSKTQQPDKSMSALLKGPAKFQALRRADFNWGSKRSSGAKTTVRCAQSRSVFRSRPARTPWVAREFSGANRERSNGGNGISRIRILSPVHVAQLRLYSKLAALLQSL
jgi:hypothetical protein